MKVLLHVLCITVAPKIERRSMRDVTLPVNSMLKFEVGIIGEPTPTVAWTMAGYPIKYEIVFTIPYFNSYQMVQRARYTKNMLNFSKDKQVGAD